MSVEDELNLDSLIKLKRIFEEADGDGSGELDIDEFCDKIGPHLGPNLTRTQIAQLFLKIDADAGGTVDWDEFTNFMFLEKSQTVGDACLENWRLFPMDFKERNDMSVYHRESVNKVYYCQAVDKYITCGCDGTIRLWNAHDLQHFKTVSNGPSWVTSCVYAPTVRKLVLSSMDRAISYFDINRGSYELSGRVYASGSMGVPLTLCTLKTTDMKEERVLYGDSKGAVAMLLCGCRELPARDLISTDDHKDYIYLHKEHSDWITQIEHVPEVGLVTSSLDGKVKTYDINREKIMHTCTHHVKAVHGFVWCRAYSLFASCGLERDIIIWQGHTGRRMGELTGHTASVTHVNIDERLNHVFSLSLDKVIKVWDLRNHKCLQTITENDWYKREDSHPSSIMYDGQRRRLVTALNKPYVWPHKIVSQDRTGHREPVKAAIYNSIFHVVVSADEGGTICVWNMQDGSREGRFSNAHGQSKLTAMCFDKNERRLLTAANDGTVKMWNFNNGSLLREYVHDDEQLEVSTVIFAADEKRESDAVYAAGWNCKVLVWEDQDADVVGEYRTFEGHREDILHMAALPDRQLLATGDYEGRINIWNLFSGEKRMWLCHRAERYEMSVERLQWLPTGKGAGPLLLLSCGGDGWMRVWHISTSGRLICTLRAAQGRLEMVSAICCDSQYTHVIVGDTAGHLRVWDVSQGVDIGSMEACRQSFVQRAHWRACQTCISSVAVVEGHELVAAACKDCNVYLWTFDGELLGILGEHVWQLDNPSTWYCNTDQGKERRTEWHCPPMEDTDNLFLQNRDEEGEVDGGDATFQDTSPPDGLSHAAMVLTEHKAKVKQAMVARPQQLHSQLLLHELVNVPDKVGELLVKATGRKERMSSKSNGLLGPARTFNIR